MEHIEIASLLSIALFASMGHCVGMCGGIVMAYSTLYHKAQSAGKNRPQSFLYKLIAHIPMHLSYHIGRITTYMALGFLVGSIGDVIMLSESAKAGVLLVVGVLLVLFGLSTLNIARLNALFTHIVPKNALIHLMRPLLLRASLWRIYALGVLNGLLPCGIVYYFLLSASVAGSGVYGAIVMGLFGLATIPALLAFGILSTSLQDKRILFLRIGAVGMIAFGCYEIYKSLRAMLS